MSNDDQVVPCSSSRELSSSPDPLSSDSPATKRQKLRDSADEETIICWDHGRQELLEFPTTLACKYSKYFGREVAKLSDDLVDRDDRIVHLPRVASPVIHLLDAWLINGQIPNQLQIMTDKMPSTDRRSTRCATQLLNDGRSENFDVLLDYYILGQALEIVELRDEVVCIWQVMRNLGVDQSLRIAPMASHERAYKSLPLESTLCRLLLMELVYEYCDGAGRSRAVERETMIRALDQRGMEAVAILLSRAIDALLSGGESVMRGTQAIDSIIEKWTKANQVWTCYLHEHDSAKRAACLERVLELQEMASAELKRKAPPYRGLLMAPITDIFSGSSRTD